MNGTEWIHRIFTLILSVVSTAYQYKICTCARKKSMNSSDKICNNQTTNTLKSASAYWADEIYLFSAWLSNTQDSFNYV